ncbi:MAG: hypothetical protein ABL952_05465 [Pyrinomonadaceae bacterium]
MSKKIIAKFFGFVIPLAYFCSLFTSCASFSSNSPALSVNSPFDPPRVIGTIKSSDITESSGIAASRCQSGVLWTHNDSGDDAFIFALSMTGESLGTWKVQNAQNYDWEDIAAYKDKNGKCFLYIGEIGDNKNKRPEHAVYKVPEPIVKASDNTSDRKSPLMTDISEILRFTYPDFNQDAETLMVHPKTGDIYVVTKRVSGPAGVYRLRPEFGHGETTRAEKIAEISVPAIPNGFVTGGDISPDGRRVVICDYTRAYEWTLADGSTFETIWAQEPVSVDLGKRSIGEAVTYSVDGTAIYATSEKKNSPVIEVKRRK